MGIDTNDWYEANQIYLMASIEVVQNRLQHFKEQIENKDHDSAKNSEDLKISYGEEELENLRKNLSVPSALDTLTSTLRLSTFERNILLMCAGVELNTSFASLCYSINGTGRNFINFSLALSAFPDAHWNALSPNGRLRYWRLIELGKGELLTTRPIRVAETILHYLTGEECFDERLTGLVEPLFTEGWLVSSHERVSEQVIQTFSRKTNETRPPIVQLCGNDPNTNLEIAANVCTKLGLNLNRISSNVLPGNFEEFNEFKILLEREMFLNMSALIIDCDKEYISEQARQHIFKCFCNSFNGTLIISSKNRFDKLQRSMVIFDVNNPTSNEQQTVWNNFLGRDADKMNGKLSSIISQFNMSTQAIRSASYEFFGDLTGTKINKDIPYLDAGEMLWNVCRKHTRPQLGTLAQFIKPVAKWDDLVLPEPQKNILEEIEIQMRQRAKVYGEWGFTDKCSRGLGISALFTGESGTGKTMAAEVLANKLQLDLYRIDLSQVVSKYIGETEKNLSRVFDEAEKGGAILLFDEADALFGKRSDVKDSHDRYANIEVSYLLQRMEFYRGLAILTTNMKNALDKAFLRRIRFVIQFPFPDSSQRAEIWSRIFPTDTPTEGLDISNLARLNIAGGNIRNIALNGAFFAAEMDEPVRMVHLLEAAQREYAKLERPLTGNEIKGFK